MARGPSPGGRAPDDARRPTEDVGEVAERTRADEPLRAVEVGLEPVEGLEPADRFGAHDASAVATAPVKASRSGSTTSSTSATSAADFVTFAWTSRSWT